MGRIRSKLPDQTSHRHDPFQMYPRIPATNVPLPSNYRISPTFHVSLLKPAGGPKGASEEGAEPQTPPPILFDGEGAYRAHELLDSRRRGGALQYLVDWEGFGPEERSWVNSGDILDPTLTEEFHRFHPEKPAPRPHGRPRRHLPPHVRSRSQREGSVTIEAPTRGSRPLNINSNSDSVSHHSSYLGLIVLPHLHLIQTHTYKQHTSMHSLRSLDFPRLSLLSVTTHVCFSGDYLCLDPRLCDSSLVALTRTVSLDSDISRLP